MYIIVALAVIVFSVLAVTTRKILRAATYLLFTLFATAVIYFMLDYESLWRCADCGIRRRYRRAFRICNPAYKQARRQPEKLASNHVRSA